MKMFHVLILAVAILGAGWMIAMGTPLQQLRQHELARRENLEKNLHLYHMQHAIQDCLDSLGKPRSTLTADDWKRVTACWIGKETTLNSPAPLFD